MLSFKPLSLLVFALVLVISLGCSKTKQILTFYDSGYVRERYFLKDGKKDGKYLMYYENGNVKREGNYIGDLESGCFLEYHINGELFIEQWFQEGNIFYISKFDTTGYPILSKFDYSKVKWNKFPEPIVNLIDSNKIMMFIPGYPSLYLNFKFNCNFLEIVAEDTYSFSCQNQDTLKVNIFLKDDKSVIHYQRFVTIPLKK